MVSVIRCWPSGDIALAASASMPFASVCSRSACFISPGSTGRDDCAAATLTKRNARAPACAAKTMKASPAGLLLAHQGPLEAAPVPGVNLLKILRCHPAEDEEQACRGGFHGL